MTDGWIDVWMYSPARQIGLHTKENKRKKGKGILVGPSPVGGMKSARPRLAREGSLKS